MKKININNRYKNAALNKSLFIIILILYIIFYNLIFCINYCYADDINEEETEILSNEEIEVSKNINTSKPIINSRKAIVYDRKTKTMLYGKNEEVKTAMASTTKIMTCLVVLEKVDLNGIVTVSSKAANTGGSRLGLKTGDKLTVNDLLYGLMLRSGNDAAVAIAEYVGGSIENFANLMNEKVEELELKNTHFVTPHGLDNSKHYTTALELAKLTDYALTNEKFASIVSTKSYTILINGYSKQLNNTNELLGVLRGVVGVKTGFTNNAGRCLVTETKRDDMDIITIVLGADTKKDRTKDSIKLIEYTFSNYKEIDISNIIDDNFNNWKSINQKRINIIKGESKYIQLQLGNIEKYKFTMKESDIDRIAYEFNVLTIIKAPIAKNTKIGTLTLRLNDEIIEEIDIVSSKEIKKKTIFEYFKNSLNLIIKPSIFN